MSRRATAKPGSRTLLVFGDVHIPHHSPTALDVFCKVAERIRPDLLICLGDLLDCGQFSAHPPTNGVRDTAYVDDLAMANVLLDRLSACCGKLVLIEGNHEWRLDRWAASTQEGRGAYSMLAPRLQLMKNRPDAVYVPYGSASGRYPHYAVNKRLIAVHGWGHGVGATRKHLLLSQGRSVIHGHNHRAEVCFTQGLWSKGAVMQSRSAGCLCKLVPFYGVGTPVEWVNAFVLGYLGRRSDTLYTVPIIKDRCILPDGVEVKA